MQAIWKGTVSFGLVSIPVRLYAATEEKGVSFRQVHDADGGRIKYKRVCSVDGEEVPYRDMVKGYELPDGDTIVLTDEDFSALPLATKRVIDVLQFVPLEQVDGIYLSKPYYLAAEGPGTKPYVLLRDALEGAGRAALREGGAAQPRVAGRPATQGRRAARPDDALAGRGTRRGPLRTRAGGVRARPGGRHGAVLHRDAVGRLRPDRLHRRLPRRARGTRRGQGQRSRGARVEEPEDTGGQVVDLMAALRASVEAAQSRRAGGSPASRPAADAPDEEPAPRKSAAGRKARRRSPPRTSAPPRRPPPRRRRLSRRRPAAKATAGKSTATKAAASKTAAAKATAKSAAGKSAAAKKAPATRKAAAKKSA